MTVLTLVELDAAGSGAATPTDASLRALALARGGQADVGAVIFADSAAVPSSTLADYGVTDVYVVEPSVLE
jgi:hypothetical protein